MKLSLQLVDYIHSVVVLTQEVQYYRRKHEETPCTVRLLPELKLHSIALLGYVFSEYLRRHYVLFLVYSEKQGCFIQLQ